MDTTDHGTASQASLQSSLESTSNNQSISNTPSHDRSGEQPTKKARNFKDSDSARDMYKPGVISEQ